MKEYVISNEDAIREYAASYYEKHKKKNNNPNDKEIEQLKAKCLQIDKYIQKLFEANDISSSLITLSINFLLTLYGCPQSSYLQ